MVSVSNDFKMAMKKPIKEIQAFIDYDESSIKDSDDLISFKISCDSGLCKTAMRKLEAKYLGSHNLLGKFVKVGYGVRLPDGEFEYLDFGTFLITELTVAKDTDTTSIVGYDLMVNAMTPYVKLDIEYPISLLDYTKLLCEACNLELGGNLLGNNAVITDVSGSDTVDVTEALNTKPLSVSIEGNSYQDGTPTPTAPVEIVTIENAIDVKMLGVNLVDWSTPYSTNAVTHLFENDVLTVSNTATAFTSAQWDILDLIKANAGKKLCFNWESVVRTDNTSGNVNLQITIDGVTTYHSLSYLNGTTDYYIIPDDTSNITACKLRVLSNNTATSQAGSIVITKPLLYFGEISNPPEYKPYQSSNYTIDLQGNELCKIGKVKDNIEIKDGKIILNKKIGKVILDGTQSFELDTTQTNTARVFFSNILDFNALSDKNLISTHLTFTSMWNRDVEGMYTDDGEKHLIVRINKATIGATANEINAYLGNNPITVYYVLAEPQIIDLGKIALNDLANGINHISVLSDLAPSNTTVTYYQGTGNYNKMNDWQITRELWENIEGITYRDIFVQIAQATASTCIIGADDKVYFKELADTGESLTYDNMFKLKLEALYGEINSVVIGRDPVVGEDVFLKDDNSIAENGLTEYRITNNEIIDKDRENAITPIFERLKGVNYYPFEATTEGLGWYEIADNITIVNDLGEEFKTSLFNYSITIDGSIKETLKTTAENKTQTQYQYATTIAKRVKNTEIIVNKQEQTIQSLVSDMNDENGVVNQKYTEIYQSIDEIVNRVQNSGGNNLIKNSVMFAYDKDEIPTHWELEGDGDLIISSDAESLAYGGSSGHGFTLLDKTVRQTVPVKVYDGENATYYTFSTKIKKDATGSCYVKIYEKYTVGDEDIIELLGSPIELESGESAHYKDYEIKGILPKYNTLIVEFYGSADSNATFTDNMLAVGEYKSQWTQANGEVMNTNVTISLDGLTVRTNQETGDYTVISQYEFAGYSKVNGTMTKVFTLNKGVTEVEKLLAKGEIKMPPLKVVPITEGDLQGWAFVPST